MTMLTRKRVILAKIETSYGVDAAPAGSANAILVRNLNVQPQATNLVARDIIRPYLGNFEQLEADTHVTLDFEVEIAGSGAAGTAPGYGVLLRACGLSETVNTGVSVVYAPISANFESATVYFNNDGVQHKITGVRGDVEMTFNAKQIPVYKFKMTGLYSAPTGVAAPTVNYGIFQTPLVANSVNTTGFSLYGYTPVLEAMSFNVGNQVDFRTLIGNQYVQITDRKASGQVTFEAVNPSTFDYFTAALGSSLGTVSLTHGTVSGNKVILASPRVDLLNMTYNDNNGVQMLQSNYTMVPSTAGNDEFSITVE